MPYRVKSNFPERRAKYFDTKQAALNYMKTKCKSASMVEVKSKRRKK